ncbi:hypothetical protein V8E54_013226 [Elaphomyces granulatus]
MPHLEEYGDFWTSQFKDLEATSFPQLPSIDYTPSAHASLNIGTVPVPETGDNYTVLEVIRLALAVLVGYYTDSDDVLFGTSTEAEWPSVKSDQSPGEDQTIFPLRIRLNPTETLEASLRTLYQRKMAAMPFTKGGIQTIRNECSEASKACDFQTVLIIQSPIASDSLKSSLESPTTNGTLVRPQDSADFKGRALVIICERPDCSDDLSIKINFDSNVVQEVEIRRLAYQLNHIMCQMYRNPHHMLQQVDVVSPEDWQQLAEWNRTIPSPSEACIYDLFSPHCNTQPEAPAVYAWDGDFSYAELDQYSARLARNLVNNGVRPREMVPVSLEKNKWAPVVMLSVLRAGAACVPIDPTHPWNRVKKLLEKIEPRVIIASQSNDPIKWGISNTIVISSSIIENLPHQFDCILPEVQPGDEAFILFTSGSTGVPKGIVMEHSNITTSIRDYGKIANVDQTTRGLHFASYAFDVSIYEIFTMLAFGGCVCIPSDSDRMNDLPGAVRRQNVNWAFLTPSTVNLFQPEDFPSLRTLLVAGEPVRQDTVNCWAGKLTMFNAYGPAEGAVCTIGQIRQDYWRPGDIGYMVGSVGWVMNPSDISKLAPIGAVGELLLEGPTVTRGYLKDESRTAAAYVEMPLWLCEFRSGVKTRLYRTGDLMRYNSDGSLKYLGRKDTQIKLRGQRIELGEVEWNVRESFEEVEEVVAEVVEFRESGLRPMLIAFVLTKDLSDANGQHGLFMGSSARFRQQADKAQYKLREKVPNYMVPTGFIPLSMIPHTSSGKIDRRLLRETVITLPREVIGAYLGTNSKKQTVSNRVERTLQRLWSGILGLPADQIGANDDFFHLGGDSISVMRLAASSRAEGINLTTLDIFTTPTLSTLASQASLLESHDSVKVTSFSLIALQDLEHILPEAKETGVRLSQSDIVDILPTTWSQSYMVTSSCPHYFLFTYNGTICEERLRAACEAAVARHSILRSLFFPYRDSFVQIILNSVTLPFSRIYTDEELSHFCKSFCDEDSKGFSHLKCVPFKFTLISRSETHHTLVARLSHAQYDGVSFRLLLEDISKAYNGKSLPPAPGFSDFVYCLRTHETDETEAAYSFWRNYLKGSTMITPEDLSVDTLDEPTAPAEILPQEHILCNPTPPSGITLATLVKSAWSLVLAEHIGRSDLVFGELVNGRSLPLANIDQVLGPCLNEIPVRVILQPGWKVFDLLHHVQTQHMRSLQYNFLSLSAVVKNCTPWPGDTECITGVDHQGSQDFILPLDVTNSSFSMIEQYELEEPLLWVYSTMRGDALDVRLWVSKSPSILEVGRTLVERLCPLIEELSRDPARPLSSLYNQSAAQS